MLAERSSSALPLPPLLLASSSAARRRCLAQLGYPFEHDAPAIDETPQPGETPIALVERLARQKAEAMIDHYPGRLIIGADQVCAHQGKIMGKPGSLTQAERQLRCCKGQRVFFYTGLALYDTTQQRVVSSVEPFQVWFRRLSDAQIAGYLQREQPLECAGSFRMEGLGITLFERLDGRDPHTLQGLPLMLLYDLLQTLGYDLLAPSEERDDE